MIRCCQKKRAGHILNGDQTGGGHRYGEGAPCKSEFPQNWNDDKILGTIETIAANDNLNWQRQQNVRGGREVTDELVLEQLVSRDASQSQQVEAKQALKAVYALPEKLKETVLLVAWEGLSHAEAAKALGCAETTVSWRIFEARRKLKGVWEG